MINIKNNIQEKTKKYKKGDIMSQYSSSITKIVNATLYKTFSWMGIGIATTATISYLFSQSDYIYKTLFAPSSSIIIMILLVIAQLGIAFTLTSPRMLKKLSYESIVLLFLSFSVMNGISLSWIFLIYQIESIIGIFFITAGMFIGISIYGKVTKHDLSAIGYFAYMALFGILIFTLINIFFKSAIFANIMNLIGIIVFALLTAFEIQQLKKLYGNLAHEELLQKKLSIYGALLLYQNFINIFIRMLKLFGEKKNK